MMTDESFMTFGKYGPDKGDRRKMKDVPAKYFLWLWDNVLHNSHKQEHQSVKEYVLHSYKYLIIDCPDYNPEHPPMD